MSRRTHDGYEDEFEKFAGLLNESFQSYNGKIDFKEMNDPIHKNGGEVMFTRTIMTEIGWRHGDSFLNNTEEKTFTFDGKTTWKDLFEIMKSQYSYFDGISKINSK